MPCSTKTDLATDSSARFPTRLDRPRKIDRTAVSVEISVDDLPAAPAGGARPDVCRAFREVADILRGRLHAVEAQVVSLARELSGPARSEDDRQRALALVTSSIEAARAGLRAVDACELKLGLERRPRPATPIPAV